ncbi:MAG: hypothetical protein HFH69_02865 [Lachnospiraceae bacterium]|nr:hypothetical protein [Lachnospiraceae bacterium]
MITDLFDEFLSLSDKMRKGYRNSLGNSYPTWENFFTKITPLIPEVFQMIYGKAAGHIEILQTKNIWIFFQAIG